MRLLVLLPLPRRHRILSTIEKLYLTYKCAGSGGRKATAAFRSVVTASGLTLPLAHFSGLLPGDGTLPPRATVPCRTSSRAPASLAPDPARSLRLDTADQHSGVLRRHATVLVDDHVPVAHRRTSYPARPPESTPSILHCE